MHVDLGTLTFKQVSVCFMLAVAVYVVLSIMGLVHDTA